MSNTNIDVFESLKWVAIVVASGLYATLFYELRLDALLQSTSPFPPVIDITIACVVWMVVLFFVAYGKN